MLLGVSTDPSNRICVPLVESLTTVAVTGALLSFITNNIHPLHDIISGQIRTLGISSPCSRDRRVSQRETDAQLITTQQGPILRVLSRY